MKQRVPLKPYYGDGRYLVAMYNLGGENVTGKELAAEMSRAAPDRSAVDPRRLYAPLARCRERGFLTSTTRAEYDPTLLHSLTAKGRQAAVHESADVAEWKERYEAGEPTDYIAESSGHKVEHVREALKAMGVKLESDPRRSGRRGPLRNATQGLSGNWR